MNYTEIAEAIERYNSLSRDDILQEIKPISFNLFFKNVKKLLTFKLICVILNTEVKNGTN